MTNNISSHKLTLWRRWLNLQSWQRILVGLIAGVLAGLALGHKAVYLKPIGSLFINAIHMMIAPVVFTAIVCAVISMNDPQKMRRVGLKTIALYMACMAAASVIGLTVATLIAPGTGLGALASVVTNNSAAATPPVPSLSDLIINMMPVNPVAAFAAGNILQILVFALIFGIAINMAGKSAKPVIDFFNASSSVVLKLAGLVMSFAPYGIFALIAWVTGEFGVQVLIPLSKFVGTVYLSCILNVLIVYLLPIALIARLNPITFLKGISSAFLFAFSSSSSAATLPITMRCAEENLGISRGIADFLLPLGTALNLNGISIYLSVAVVFAANMYGIPLGLTQYLTVILTIIFICMGAGGVPGSAIIVMSAVMSSIGLPLGAIPLIAGVDRLNDMASTGTSVLGDTFAALLVAKSEKEFDPEIYKKTGAAGK